MGKNVLKLFFSFPSFVGKAIADEYKLDRFCLWCAMSEIFKYSKLRISLKKSFAQFLSGIPDFYGMEDLHNLTTLKDFSWSFTTSFAPVMATNWKPPATLVCQSSMYSNNLVTGQADVNPFCLLKARGSQSKQAYV